MQAMRVIINDKRYGVLKSLSERKQAFDEASSASEEKSLGRDCSHYEDSGGGS